MSFAITALRSAMLTARMSNAQFAGQQNNQARLSAANNAPSFGGAKALNLDKSLTMKNSQASLEHTAAKPAWNILLPMLRLLVLKNYKKRM